MNDVDAALADYLEKLDELSTAVKLAAFHAGQAADQSDKAANEALISVWHINEYLRKL